MCKLLAVSYTYPYLYFLPRYVRNNVVTSPLPIDRNISKLEHCECKDNCTNEESCKCSDISVRSWYDQSGKSAKNVMFLINLKLFSVLKF